MEPNKALKAMLAIGIVMFIIATSALLATFSLQKENAQLKEDYIKLVNERAKCSPLGICIGDKVEQTDEAKRQNMTISGVVAKVISDNLIIDTGNENWQAVNEMWVKHKKNPFGICYGVPNTTTPDPTDWMWICDKGVEPPKWKPQVDEKAYTDKR